MDSNFRSIFCLMNNREISCWTPEIKEEEDSPLNTYVRKIGPKINTQSGKCLAELPSLCKRKSSAALPVLDSKVLIRPKPEKLGVSRRLDFPRREQNSKVNQGACFIRTVQFMPFSEGNLKNKKKVMIKRKLSCTSSFVIHKTVDLSRSFGKRLSLFESLNYQ